MADEPESRVATFEVASSKLWEGLKSCRAVMASYRAMIAGEQCPAGMRIEDDVSSDACGPAEPAAEPEHASDSW